MIKLNVDPIVLQRLAESFPSPTNSATRALRKYTELLEELLTEAIMLRRSAYDRKFSFYSILVNKLAHDGPRIGSSKIRLHKWLNDNDLALIKIVKAGNNITAEKSKVRLTDLASATDVFSIEATDSDSYRLSHDNLAVDEITVASIASFHYPDFTVADWTEGKLKDRYDAVRVNLASLEAYLSWVLTKTYKIKQSKREEYARHAQFVLMIASHFDGYFPQRKIQSDFGRTYYAGISIQNVNKMLRRAIVAPACEYDINTSVCAWKLGVVYESITAGNREQQVKATHSALYQYVTGKTEFIENIRIDVFPSTDKAEHEHQRKLIKNALTALSFGATLKTKGWNDKSGSRRYPAISTVFGKDVEAAKRFISNAFVTDFTNDHAKIDAFIFSEFQTVISSEDVPNYLKTKSGRVGRSKVIAYMYQHSETALMNELRAFVAARIQRKVLASVHDAVILDKPLIGSVKVDLVEHLRQHQDNPFINLKKTELEPFLDPHLDGSASISEALTVKMLSSINY